MDASSQHAKAELTLTHAKELIGIADALLMKTQKNQEEMKQRIASQEKKHITAHATIDDAIRAELEKMTKVADDYLKAFDELQDRK